MKAEIFIWPLYLTVSNRERRVASRLKIVVADMALICLSIAVVQFFFFFRHPFDTLLITAMPAR